MSGLIGNIPEFCCESEEWEEYSERLEQFFLINDVSAEKRTFLLISVLNKKVYSTLQDLCRPDLPEEKSFDELCQLLQKLYSTSTPSQPNPNVPRSTLEETNKMEAEEIAKSRKESFCIGEESNGEQEEKEERDIQEIRELKRREREDKRRDMEKKQDQEDREERERRERRRLLLEAEERDDKKRRLEREKRRDEERRRERADKLAREERLAAELRDRKKQRQAREERLAKEEREEKLVAANKEDGYLQDIIENERKAMEKQAVEEAARIEMYARNVEMELQDLKIKQLEMSNQRYKRKMAAEQAKHKEALENANRCIIM